MPKPHAAKEREASSPEAAFGRVLRKLRQTQSVSQEELGAKSGYHRTYIGQLERGEKSPSLRTIFNLAATLKVAPSRIITGVERALGRTRL
jgi:transcriptional regulator with XRE-family HTH domain